MPLKVIRPLLAAPRMRPPVVLTSIYRGSSRDWAIAGAQANAIGPAERSVRRVNFKQQPPHDRLALAGTRTRAGRAGARTRKERLSMTRPNSAYSGSPSRNGGRYDVCDSTGRREYEQSAAVSEGCRGERSDDCAGARSRAGGQRRSERQDRYGVRGRRAYGDGRHARLSERAGRA